MSKPTIFFDLETTGVNITQDRILQIGAIKLFADGTEEVKNVLLNPGIPIPEGASAVHGIYDKDVKDKPFFRQISKSFATWLSGSNLAGYNSDNFDVPMLIEEFNRVGITFPEPDTKFIDVLKIERLVNSHTLGNTYKRYTGEELDGAHDALIDIYATIKIFQKQLENNPDLPSDAAEIDALCQGENTRVDFAGKLYEKDGEVYWRFGKHRDQRVADTQDYCNWVLKSDFPSETKMQIRRVLEKQKQQH
ncbi:MAG: 3'-5' exonuclease [Bacteroidetes bacterium]|jgi:DNA polymerase-3 subunit epsilon|nr:3'-5' exonuclease [Bacteroidota bacterium]